MRTSILMIVMAGLWAPLSAETPNRYYGSGYASVGVGSCAHRVTNVSFGAGGDAFLFRGLTAGAEIGHYQFVERGSDGFGIAGFNAGYHWNRRGAGRTEPFVSAGPAIVFGNASSPGASFGGGVNYWFSRRLGLRLEGRLYGFAGDAIAKFRVGISFR